MKKTICFLLFVGILFGSAFSLSFAQAASSLTPPEPEQTVDTRSNPRFEVLSVEDGLSQSTVRAILQDNQGFLWFGTDDGLNRYDGENFIVYKSDPENPESLPDSSITALARDPDGGIWIGTRLGGISYYNPLTGAFTSFTYDAANPGSINSPSINCLYIDHDGRLLVGTPYGLNVFDKETDTFEHIQQSNVRPFSGALNNILSIYRSTNGTLWLGTSYGLVSYSFVDGWFYNYAEHSIYTETSLAREVHQIREDIQGGLWLVSRNGISRFDPLTGKVTTYQHDETDPTSLSDQYVYDLIVDTLGTIWVGTKNGLNRFDQKTNDFIHFKMAPQNPFSLSSNVILSMYEDLEGIIWLGTFGGGVNKLDRSKAKFDLYQSNPDDPGSLSPYPIFGITEGRDGSLWIATYGGGLDRLDLVTGKVTHYRHDPMDADSLIYDYLWSVYEDRSGNLWVGSEGGLDRFNRETGIFTHYLPDPGNPKALGGPVIGQIYEDSGGALWIATSGGITRYYRDTGLFENFEPDSSDPDSFSSSQPTTIYETTQGDLWFGTYNRGLEVFLSNDKQFRHYRHNPQDASSLSGDSICAIYQDSRGILWIATCNAGLERFDPASDTFTHLTVKDGLPSNVILGIVEDGSGKLWLSTKKGVACFNPVDDMITNYGISDGLQSDEFDMFSYARLRDGRIVFGGIDGLNIFEPDNVSANPYIPPIVLTGFTQGGEAIAPLKSKDDQILYEISWPNNYFEFEYAALSFSDPKSNQYEFKLEPFDKGWIEMSSRRFGRYTNLPGGNYTLRIKGSNNDGIWNDEGLKVAVKVIPPLWNNLWVQLVTALTVMALVFGGYRWRLRNIQSSNRELERQVQERTAEIKRLFEKTKELAVIEERNRLARDLHDSVKQKAFAAMAQLGTAQAVLAQNPISAKPHLQEAETLVSDVIEELTFLIQEMYPMVLKKKGLLSVLRSHIYEWQERNSIQANLEVFDEHRVEIHIEQALFRIIQEALSNVARHSAAKRVDLNLHFFKNRIELVIHDDGCGFDKSTCIDGVGLKSMQERARMIKGQLEVATGAGQGTTITLMVPLRNIKSKMTG